MLLGFRKCFFLVLLMSFASAHVLGEPPIKEASEHEIAALIEQLGAARSTDRDVAVKRLIEIGPLARPHLEKLLQGEEDVMQRRIKIVIAGIDRRATGVNRDAFVAGIQDASFPGWDEFRRVAGDSKLSRKFFLKMQKAEPKLLKAYGSSPEAAATQLNYSWLAQINAKEDYFRLEMLWRFGIPMQGVPMQDEVLHNKLLQEMLVRDAALLLVAGDSRVSYLSSQINYHQKKRSAWKRPVSFCDLFAKVEWTKTPTPTSEEQFAQKLLSRWLERPAGNDCEDDMRRLRLADKLQLRKEGAKLAVSILENSSTVNDEVFKPAEVAAYLAAMGDREHIEVLEPLLEDEAVAKMARSRKGGKITVQVRDVALFAMIHLSEQKLEDYRAVKSSERSLQRYMQCYFKNAEDRQRALAKWHAWAKENPNLEYDATSALQNEKQPTKEEIVRVAVQDLLKMQEESGRWTYWGRHMDREEPEGLPYGCQVGGTSIVSTALLLADPQNKDVQAAVQRALKWLFQALDHPKMGPRNENVYDVRIWGHCYALEFLCYVRAYNMAGEHAKEVDNRIWQLVETIAWEEIDGGGWNYAHNRHSASFVTAPVAQSLLLARSQGAKVPEELLDRARKKLEEARVPGEDGAFHYGATGRRRSSDSLPGSASRSLVCEATRVLLGDGSVKAVQFALDNFYTNWLHLEARRAQPGGHAAPYAIAPYYFYYAHRYAGQAVALLPEEKRAQEQERLLQTILKTRGADGTWNDREPRFARSCNVGTAFIVLALLGEKALPPRWHKEN